jgi:hypothetical protein
MVKKKKIKFLKLKMWEVNKLKHSQHQRYHNTFSTDLNYKRIHKIKTNTCDCCNTSYNTTTFKKIYDYNVCRYCYKYRKILYCLQCNIYLNTNQHHIVCNIPICNTCILISKVTIIPKNVCHQCMILRWINSMNIEECSKCSIQFCDRHYIKCIFCTTFFCHNHINYHHMCLDCNKKYKHQITTALQNIIIPDIVDVILKYC